MPRSIAVHPAPSILPLALFAGIITIALVGAWGDADLTSEEGMLETLSVVAYVVAGIAFLTMAGPIALRRLWHVPILILAAAARELDIDKSLLSGGLLKSRFYLGDAPGWEKGIGLAIVALILWGGWRLLRHGLPAVWAARRHGSGWPRWAVAGIALLAVGKTLDGLERKLDALGMAPSGLSPDALVLLEETSEMAGALAILISVALWLVRRRNFQNVTPL
jgi:hypothetical protein